MSGLRRLLSGALAGLAALSGAGAAPPAPALAGWRIAANAVYAGLQTPQEYISGFMLYVRWPDDASITAWQVCAAGTPAGETHYAGLIVRERKLAPPRRVGAGDDLAGCHVLDLTGVDAIAATAMLKRAQGQRGLLTVGSGRGFCSSGGLICLRTDDPQGGFEINLSGVRNAGFSINAKLLMLAHPAAAGAVP